MVECRSSRCVAARGDATSPAPCVGAGDLCCARWVEALTISRSMCIRITELAADTCIREGISWVVTPMSAVATPSSLAAGLEAARRLGRPFEMPTSAATWFPVSYAVTDTALPFTLLYVWLWSCLPGKHGNHHEVRAILVWYLRHSLPAPLWSEVKELDHALRLPPASAGSQA
jgi:hypothetical protein